MTEPTKAELNEAVARWDGWQTSTDDGVVYWHEPSATDWRHGRYGAPDYHANTTDSQAVAWRLLVEMSEREGGFARAAYLIDNTSPLGTDLLLAVYRAAWAAGLIGGERG